MTNQAKRVRAQYALMKYQETAGTGAPRNNIIYLITDLLHYAHAEGIDTALALDLAALHYQLEVNDHDND